MSVHLTVSVPAMQDGIGEHALGACLRGHGRLPAPAAAVAAVAAGWSVLMCKAAVMLAVLQRFYSRVAATALAGLCHQQCSWQVCCVYCVSTAMATIAAMQCVL